MSPYAGAFATHTEGCKAPVTPDKRQQLRLETAEESARRVLDNRDSEAREDLAGDGIRFGRHLIAEMIQSGLLTRCDPYDDGYGCPITSLRTWTDTHGHSVSTPCPATA